MEIQVRGGASLRGHVRPPGDKSISHRALILSALAEGESQIFGLSDGEDVGRTASALSAMGAEISLPDDLGSPEAEVRVVGGKLSEPSKPLYLGNSGTSMRLLAGVCAAHQMDVILDGDESLRSRPMQRIVEPLSLMGAAVASASEIDASESDVSVSQAISVPSKAAPPLAIKGGNLSGIDYTLPVASAQVKGAILLAGLRAKGETIVREFLPSRIHTEEMLAKCGADIAVTYGGEFHQTTKLRPSQIQPHIWHIPADPSQSAFWIVAALCAPASEIVVENVYIGPGREGFIDVLLRMGAKMEFEPKISTSTSEGFSDTPPRGIPPPGIPPSGIPSIRAKASSLIATDIGPKEVPRLIDEIPVLAVAAAYAQGITRFHGVGELRAKESDRVASICTMLRSLGGQIEAEGDTLTIQGTGGLQHGQVDAAGDHRIAMSAAVSAMAMPAGSEVSISGWEAVATSYPRFLEDAAVLGVRAQGTTAQWTT